VATLILLLLLLAALVAAFVAFENFQSEIRGSNGRVPAATKRALAPSHDALSTPQLVLIVFDRAVLIARTDPSRRVVSFISIPGSAHLRTPGGTTVADVLRTSGDAGLVRFARGALDLQVTHVALLRPHDVAPLIDAIGGIRIKDASSFGGFVQAGRSVVLNGADAQRYVASAGPSASRTRRERAVLGAIMTRLSSATSLLALPGLARAFSANVATDLSPRETLDLALVRLSSKQSIQCGLPAHSTLEQAHSKDILQQFEGVRPTPLVPGRVFPADGCRAAPLSLRASATVISFGKQALALFPVVPELAAVAIAFDLILLLALVGVPQALIGMARTGRKGGRSPRRVSEAKPRSLSSASVRPEDEATEEEAIAAPRRRPFLPTPPRRVPPPSMSSANTPSLRRSEKLKAAFGRQSRHGGVYFIRNLAALIRMKLGRLHLRSHVVLVYFRQHRDVAWTLGAVAVAIFLGYLIANL
jgi:anionic cell wall polymer biosynthesis LytR-Cps2A-Psr (LCP) family protein